MENEDDKIFDISMDDFGDLQDMLSFNPDINETNTLENLNSTLDSKASLWDDNDTSTPQMKPRKFRQLKPNTFSQLMSASPTPQIGSPTPQIGSPTPQIDPSSLKDETDIDLESPELDISSILDNSINEAIANKFDSPNKVDLSKDNDNDIQEFSAITSDNEDEDIDDDDDDTLDFTNIKKILICVGIFAAIVIFIAILGSFKNHETTTPTTPTASTNTFSNTLSPNISIYDTTDVLTCEDVSYTDYLVVNKNLVIWGGTTFTILSGTTTKENLNVKIPVTLGEYNNLTDGQIITIYYNKMDFNGKIYATNITLGEVVGQ